MKTTARDWLLVAASSLAAVLVAEAVARAVVRPVTPFVRGFQLNTSNYYMRDEELGWVPRPNVRAEHNVIGSFRSTFSTNSLGLRDDEPLEGPNVRAVRIVALGDSFTWGYGVNDDEIYTKVLEDLLPTVEVVNLGVTAYGLRQELGYFRRIGRGMHPDIVVLALVTNDIIESLRRLPGDTPKAREARFELNADSNRKQDASGVRAWLGSHSALYRAAGSVVNANKTLVDLLVWLGLRRPPAGLEGLDTNLQPFLRSYPERVHAAVEAAAQQLLDVRDEVRQAGSKLLVVAVPALQSVDEHDRRNSIANTQYYERDFDLDKPYRWLKELGKTAGIEILVPVGRFRERHAAGATLYLPNDMHFNAAGHRLFAEKIAAFLADHRWIH